MMMAKAIEYKVVESSVVTEDELTKLMNRMHAEGWAFDAFHFVMREGSHRPAMVFATFHRGTEVT